MWTGDCTQKSSLTLSYGHLSNFSSRLTSSSNRFPSTPTVRSHQHVAIGLGNPVRELAVPVQVSAYGQVPHRRAAETPL